MGRAPRICAQAGCPEDAVRAGRCEDHQRKPWHRRSPSSVALSSSRPHRRERAAAMRRAGGQCEGTGCTRTDGLQLHHPVPISAGGPIVQADALLLCTSCHRAADRHAGVTR